MKIFKFLSSLIAPRVSPKESISSPVFDDILPSPVLEDEHPYAYNVDGYKTSKYYIRDGVRVVELDVIGKEREFTVQREFLLKTLSGECVSTQTVWVPLDENGYATFSFGPSFGHPANPIKIYSNVIEAMRAAKEFKQCRIETVRKFYYA